MTHKDLPELPKPEGVFWTDHGYGREPIPRATFQYPADQMHAYGRKCYDLGARSTAAQPAGWLDDWEWEQLAWQLCAEEHGEDACNELIWEGGPIPEPWGDRWLKYEGEAKRMIALVRQYAPPAASGDSTPPSAPVQGDPSGALRPEPEAVGQGRWIAVTERQPKGREVILVAVSWVRHYEHEDGTPAETTGYDVTEGQYVPKHGEGEGYFESFQGSHGDSYGVTHWQPLPEPPQASVERGD